MSSRAEGASPSVLAHGWETALGPARAPAEAAHQLAYRVYAFAREPERTRDLTPWQQLLAVPTGPWLSAEMVGALR